MGRPLRLIVHLILERTLPCLIREAAQGSSSSGRPSTGRPRRRKPTGKPSTGFGSNILPSATPGKVDSVDPAHDLPNRETSDRVPTQNKAPDKKMPSKKAQSKKPPVSKTPAAKKSTEQNPVTEVPTDDVADRAPTSDIADDVEPLSLAEELAVEVEQNAASTHAHYEQIKQGDIHIAELQQMSMAQLIDEARRENVSEVVGLKKQDLIFRILKERVKMNGLMYGEGHAGNPA